MSEKVTDEELVKGCAKEIRKYQELLYQKYNRKMFAVCFRYAKDRDQALDMMQEGFIKIYNNIGKFNHTGSLEGWIRRIMVNTSINVLRKDKNHMNVDDVNIKIESKQSTVLEKLSAEEILKVINTLPAGYKTVFNLFAIEGYSHKEIAEKLNVAESTSRTQYLKAKQALQKIFTKNNIHTEYVRK